MVGVPGRSKGCNTCKQRKVACSLERPECRTCVKASRVCAGYQRERIFIQDPRTQGDGPKSYRKPDTQIQKAQGGSRRKLIEHVLNLEVVPEGLPWGSFSLHPLRRTFALALSPSARAANRQQMLSQFISLWPGLEQVFQNTNNSTSEPMGSWILMLPTLPDLTPALETSLLAICSARLGRVKNDPILVRESLKLYTQGLRELQRALWDPNLMYRDETAAASMLLTFYEVYECPDKGTAGWISHMKGCAKLFELKGPKAYGSDFGYKLFLNFRLMEIQQAITERRSTYLARPEWSNLPFKNRLKSQYQKFLDLMALLPNILGDGYQMLQQPMETQTIDPSALFMGVLELIERSWKLDAKFQAFSKDMEREKLGPLSWPELSTGVVTADDEAEMGKVFPVAFQFQNLKVAHLSGFQAMIMATMPKTPSEVEKSPLQNFDIARLPPLEHRTDVASLARNICQSLEYCLKNGEHGIGKTMSALPIKVAIETFHDAEGCERELGWAVKAMEVIIEDGARIMGNLGVKWTDHVFLPG